MADTKQKFRANEELIWVDSGSTPTRRMVLFEAYEKSHDPRAERRAVVDWATNRMSVPVRELSRPEADQNRTPLYHDKPLSVSYTQPTPASEERLTARLTQCRAALAEAHEGVRRAKDVVRSTSELVSRAAKEFEASRAALLQLDARLRLENHKLESALRRGETPPAMEPAEDRAAVVQRTTACQAALAKFQGEDRAAQARLSEAMSTVRREAGAVLAAYLDIECAELYAVQEFWLLKRADLTRISQLWPDGVNSGPIKLSEASAAVLTNAPDVDRARFMSTKGVTQRWQALYQRLMTDPAADFEQPVSENTAEAAE